MSEALQNQGGVDNPRWIKGEKPFFREEEKDYILIHPPRFPKAHFINRIGAYILEHCDGEHSPEEIAEGLHSQFPSQPFARIRSDVLEGLYFLRTTGLIKWKGETRNESGLRIDLAHERDFSPVERFLRSFKKDLMKHDGDDGPLYLFGSPELRLGYVDIAMRTRHFHHREVFLIAERDSELIGMATMVRTHLPTIWLIGTMAVKGFEVEIYDALLYRLTMLLRDKGAHWLKLRVSPDLYSQQTTAFFEERGFSFEAELKDELGEGKPIQVYSKRLVEDQAAS